MTHLDLFSGIGGFALAADRVWPGIEHTFVESDVFCQAILQKHYPNSTIHGDIRAFIADTERERRESDGSEHQTTGRDGQCDRAGKDENPFILTGGFPCQPFSHAGRRKGTADDRYLWPEMFRVIQLYKPTWVIAENVRGLVTWNEGMVFETVCADLESEGYEVQPFIIPAVAVGAPHRRDRVWIVAHAQSEQSVGGRPDAVCGKERGQDDELHTELTDADSTASDTRCERWSAWASESVRPARQEPEQPNSSIRCWERDWRDVARETCSEARISTLGRIIRRYAIRAGILRMDDGLPRQMDGVTISAARHRKERLKACGNAIVPQVAEEIMKAMV